MERITEINKQFNLEFWKNLKFFALTTECYDNTHLFLKSGVEGDESMLKEKVFEEQLFSDGKNAEKFLKMFMPQYSFQTFKDILISLAPSVETSLYSLAAKNTMVKIFDIFHKFLNDISVDLIESNSNLYFSSEDAKITKSFVSISGNQDITTVFNGYRVNKLRELGLYSKISFIEKGFDIKFDYSDEDIRKIIFWEQAVKVIEDNQSIIDKPLLSIIQNQNPANELELGDKISVNLEDVFDIAKIVSELRSEVFYKITGEQPSQLESDPLILNDPSIEDSLFKNMFHNNLKKKVGRNEPCPCGSGKKYKHCCLR